MGEMNKTLKKEEVKNLISETLSLIHLYKKNGLTIPFALKGNIGEFIVYNTLLTKFPHSKIEFSGGAMPGYDIQLDNLKIQVKTKIVEEEKYALVEGCPTIKKKIIDEKKCDFIILLAIRMLEDFSNIKEINTYIFSQDDFKYFSTTRCWSGRSKGDYTICNVIWVKENAPKGYMQGINYYNNNEYHGLFNSSKNNWEKIKEKIDLKN